MSTMPLAREIYYPESDGRPMAETQAHGKVMVDLLNVLERRYAGVPDVYVWGNMFLFYEEGNPRACEAPDLFLVKGVDKRVRRTYKLWEEGRVPSLVIESVFGLVIVLQWRCQAVVKCRDPVCFLSHEGEQGIQTGDPAGVAPFETAHFVQSLHPEEIRSDPRTVQEQHGAYAFLGKASPQVSHGILPGQGIGRRADDQLAIADSLGGIGS